MITEPGWYKTRGGDKVGVCNVQSEGMYTVIGGVYRDGICRAAMTWLPDGRWKGCGEHDNDIIGKWEDGDGDQNQEHEKE